MCVYVCVYKYVPTYSQIELLEMKSTLDGINSRLNTGEKRLVNLKLQHTRICGMQLKQYLEGSL